MLPEPGWLEGRQELVFKLKLSAGENCNSCKCTRCKEGETGYTYNTSIPMSTIYKKKIYFKIQKKNRLLTRRRNVCNSQGLFLAPAEGWRPLATLEVEGAFIRFSCGIQIQQSQKCPTIPTNPRVQTILRIFRTYFVSSFFGLKVLPVLFCKLFPSLLQWLGEIQRNDHYAVNDREWKQQETSMFWLLVLAVD